MSSDKDLNVLSVSLLVLASGLLSWGVRFRARRIVKKSREASNQYLERHPKETDVSPLLNGETGETSILARRWLKNMDWMLARWERESRGKLPYGEEHELARRSTPIEERDLRYLANRGVEVRKLISTKGQLFDILGLIEMPTPHQANQLQYFGVSTRELNRTTAEREIGWLMESPANRQQWLERGLDPLQEVFFSLFDVPIPKGLRAVNAAEIIEELLNDASEADTQKRGEWKIFESIYLELSSEYVASRLGLTQPTAQEVFVAFSELRKAGVDGVDQYVEIDVVAKRLLRNNPKLSLKASRKPQAVSAG